jgi:hypothetical protein
MFDLIALIEGLISSVPEAISLWHRVAPLISPNADIHPDQIAEVNALVPEAHAAVEIAHAAIAALIGAHTPIVEAVVVPAV